MNPAPYKLAVVLIAGSTLGGTALAVTVFAGAGDSDSPRTLTIAARHR